MMKIFVGLASVGALIWVLFGYFGIQALFTNRVVDESVPVAILAPSVTSSGSAVEGVRGTSTVPVASTVMARGMFRQGDSTYSIQGKATITKTEQGRMLSLTDFRVTNGPDLFVYLVSADGVENREVKDAVRQNRFVNLGVLKGNQGNQTYSIPDEVRLDDASVVSVWCRRFSRNFGAASLDLEPAP